MTDLLAKAGGIFAVLVFIHFFIDFIFQSHDEAMVKHSSLKIRARHCAVYTTGFFPILILLELNPVRFLIATVILFISHMIEDSYYPVYLWAKFFRRPPEMDTNPTEGFILFIQTTLGKILIMVIDQVIHLTFLWAIVLLSMY